MGSRAQDKHMTLEVGARGSAYGDSNSLLRVRRAVMRLVVSGDTAGTSRALPVLLDA